MTPEEAVIYEGPDKIVHFTDFLLSRASSRGGLKTFRSNFPMFDSKSGGLQTGEVIVISGHRKEGKTLFAESWAKGMCESNPEAKSALFSFEVPADTLLVKYMKMEHLPIYVPSSLQASDFNWLVQRCKEAKYKYNCRIILLDHLGFLVDMAINNNMHLNIGAFMRKLKQEIAIGLNLGVILIAHQGQPKDGKEASIDTLRDSSAIAQESDSTIIVSRRENLNNVELMDYATHYGVDLVEKLKPQDNIDHEDKFSANLAIVKIECHRRTGIYRWKKLFQKRGDFMEEV